MFIGQFAVGLAVKKLFVLIPVIHTPRLWICSTTPRSHSLAMSLVWATPFAAIYHRAVRYWPGTLAIWIGVVSHGLLDGVTHGPDMPLYPCDGPRLGLGLWNSIAGTMIVEISMLAVGVWLCARTARDRSGQYSFAAYVVLLLIPYVGDRFSTDPPTVSDILWTAIIAEVLVLAGAWWFDYHRDLRSESLSGTYLRR